MIFLQFVLLLPTHFYLFFQVEISNDGFPQKSDEKLTTDGKATSLDSD